MLSINNSINECKGMLPTQNTDEIEFINEKIQYIRIK